jgi:hypothetical protein
MTNDLGSRVESSKGSGRALVSLTGTLVLKCIGLE